MKLSQVLAEQVPSQSRARGFSYFKSAAVRSLTTDNGIIHATVRGGELYDVWLEPAGDLLRASCTCPFFVDRYDICKHVWAVILAAEAQGVPLLTPGIPVSTVDIEPMIPEDVDLDDEADALWTPVAATRRPRHARRAPPPWRTFINDVSHSVPASRRYSSGVAAGQLIYVVDIASTAANYALVIDVMSRERKVNGEWGKPTQARLTAADVAAMPDPADREILERLSGARPLVEWSYGGYGGDLSRVQVRGVTIPEILTRACATGRCMLRIGDFRARPSSASLAPLAWDDGAPWTFAVRIEAAGSGGYAIEGWLSRDGERMELTDALALLPEGVLFTTTHAARLSHGDALNWLTALRRTGRVTVPKQAGGELADALLVLGPMLVAAPDDLRVDLVPGQPRPHLRLRPKPGSGRRRNTSQDRLGVELSFEYEGLLVDPESPRQIVRVAGTSRAIRRDPDAERRAVDQLLERGARYEWNYQTGAREFQLTSNLVPRVVRHLLDDGWHVEAAGRTYRRPSTTPALQVASGIDWFELRGEVTYDDQQASLPALLAALDRGDGFVTLDDGTIGLLPEEWLRTHAPIARLGSRNGSHIRFKASQVGAARFADCRGA